MQTLKLNAKQGFYSPGAVQVYDKRGLFLEYSGPAYFNLPAGQYTYMGRISALEQPVDYGAMQLQPADKPPIPPWNVNMHIVLSNDTPKMRVDYETGEMQVNPDWASTLSTPEYEGATRHEAGHYFYTGGSGHDQGERNCDRFAAKTMLDEGYNPSQLKNAFSKMLCSACSEQSAWRIQEMANEMDQLEANKNFTMQGGDAMFENFEQIMQ